MPDKVSLDQYVEETATKYGANPDMVREIFWVAFRAYIYREILRHKGDVHKGEQDDQVLARKGYPLILIPTDLWIEA